MKWINLQQYAEDINVSYQTAWRHWKAGLIPGAKLSPTGKVLIPLNYETINTTEAVIDARYIDGMAYTLQDQFSMLREYLLSRGIKILGQYADRCSRLNLPGNQLQIILQQNTAIYMVSKEVLGPIEKTVHLLKPNLIYYLQEDLKLHEPIWADVEYISKYYLSRGVNELLIKKCIKILQDYKEA